MQKGAVDLNQTLKDRNIKLITFDFSKKIKAMSRYCNNQWYIWYDQFLDNQEFEKRFFIAKEIWHIHYSEKNNDRIWHITVWDYDPDIKINDVKQEHIDLAKEFIEFIK